MGTCSWSLAYRSKWHSGLRHAPPLSSIWSAEAVGMLFYSYMLENQGFRPTLAVNMTNKALSSLNRPLQAVVVNTLVRYTLAIASPVDYPTFSRTFTCDVLHEYPQFPDVQSPPTNSQAFWSRSLILMQVRLGIWLALCNQLYTRWGMSQARIFFLQQDRCNLMQPHIPTSSTNPFGRSVR